MENCIFCKIIDDKIPSKTVYEDDLIKIIMNINPNTNGHLLVLPKTHVENLFDTSNDIITHSLDTVRNNIYPLLKEKLNCKGLTLAQNNEYGQEIKHYHLHLIPRYENDNADFTYDKDNLDTVENIFDKLNN